MEQTNETIKRLAALYKDLGWKRFFPRLRFWYAPYVEVEQMIPKEGTIVELGSGEGMFSNFLGLMSSQRKVVGIEIDTVRVKQADRGIKNVSFQKGDITTISIPKANVIVLFQVLHHLPSYQLQERVIEQAYSSLQSDGQLIIVEIYKRKTLRYLVTWFTDHFLVAMVFDKKLYIPIYFRPLAEWVKLLHAHNFRTSVIPSDKKLFSNVIIVCKKSKQL